MIQTIIKLAENNIKIFQINNMNIFKALKDSYYKKMKIIVK